MPVNYLVGADAAIITQYDTVKGIVLGLNSLTLPGLTRTIITIEEFRNDFGRQFSGGGNFGTIDYSGNAVTNDLTGQDYLRGLLKSR